MDKDYLIKKWLTNALTEAEEKAFKSLDNAELYEEIIQESQRFSGDLQNKVPSFETLDKTIGIKKASKLQWVKIASTIAAIFVIGLFSYTYFIKDNFTTFKTTLAQNEVITLPDNSIVNLNELSQLKYSPSNWDENRVLDLNGEAFFDVEKGKRFDVNTKLGKVSVLGTEFNVISRDSTFKVSCYEGLVQVTYNNEIIKLAKGHALTFVAGHKNTSNIVVTQPYWLKNLSVFENATLADVISDLEKQYNVKIDYPLDLKSHFTGAFEHNNLNNALEAITQPLNLTYTINNKNDIIITNAEN